MPMSETSEVTIRRREGSTARSNGAVDAQGVQAEVEALERLDLGALRIQWRNRWGRLAPASLPRGLLYRVMAYRLQAEAFGDLDRETVRLLDRLAKEAPHARSETNTSNNIRPDNVGPGNVGPPVVATPGEPNRRGVGSPPTRNDVAVPMMLKPGALLTREWQGRIERVMALERGFAWNGQTFASLSGVAFAITGVKWSGQRFFFGSAGRDGAAPAAMQPARPLDPKPGRARHSATFVGAGIGGSATGRSPPSSPAATSSDRPNWRRNGNVQGCQLSREPGR